MAIEELRLKVKLAWWFRPYVYCLAVVSAITGREPDWGRVQKWIDRALRIKAE